MAAALAYRWDGARTRLYFQTQDGTYNEHSLIEFVRELRRHFWGQQVILLWDGLPSHRSKLMTQYLAGQRHWLDVRRLPAYAPELNPVENVWEYLRQNKLGHRVWPDYEAIVATCCEAWNWLAAAPDRLASITRREWAKAVTN